MATSKYLSQLAKHTQALVNKVAYGHLRGKLKKKGFSEIALYAAVGRHCEENDIAPFDMAKDMLDLLQGCVENEFFIRVDNRFSFLAREFHELRYANKDKGEMKCPEQRGQFLCNNCHLVKKEHERAGGKAGHTCKICHQNKSAAAYQKKKKAVEEQQVEPAEEIPPVQEVPPATVVPKEIEDEPIEIPQVSDDALELTEEEIEQLLQPAACEEIPTKSEQKELFKITQIIGDTDETEFKIVCSTQDLPTVIGILKELQQ